MKKLIIFITSIRTGGGRTFVLKLSEALGPENMRLAVLGGETAAEKLCGAITIARDSVFRIANVLDRKTIVVSNSQICALFGAFLYPRRHYYVTHGFASAIAYLPVWRKYLWAMQCNLPGTRFIACGPSEYEAIRRYVVLKTRVLQINNGIVYNNYSRKRTTDNERPFQLVYIGRIAFQKGVDVLLEALALVEIPIQLTIIGGEQKAERSFVEQVRLKAEILKGRVRFIGEQLVTTATFEDYDALVSPSRFEGLPYLLLEAANAEIPIICSDCPGNRDVAPNEEYAFTHKSEDVADLRRAMLAFSSAPAEDRKRRANRLKEYVRLEYSESAFRIGYERLI